MRRWSLMVLLATLLPVGVSGAEYREIEVTSAGAVRGTVLWEGDIPQPVRFELLADTALCGPAGFRDMIAADVDPKTRGVRNAVVYLKSVREGLSFDAVSTSMTEELRAGLGTVVSRAALREFEVVSKLRTVSPNSVMTLRACDLQPVVCLVRVGDRLKLVSDDPIFEELLAEGPRGFASSVGLPLRGAVAYLRFPHAGPYRLTSARHPWIRCIAFAVEHPYYELTATDGGFAFSGVPPGSYQIVAWHDGMGAEPIVKKALTVGYKFPPPYESSRRITVHDDEKVEVRLVLSAPAR